MSFLDRESSVRDWILRIGLIAAALALWESINELYGADMVGFSLPTWLGLVEYGFSFAVIVLATRRRQRVWFQWIVLLALSLILVNHEIAFAVAEYQHGQVWEVDNYLYADYAARMLRMGVNPYSVDLADSYRAFRASRAFDSPLLRDDISGTAMYAPLQLLALLPFQWLGIPSQYTYVALTIAALGLIFFFSPTALRPIILLPFFLVEDFRVLPSLGVSEIIWIFPALLMILSWRHERWRAVLFGLACATKQNAWLLAPFLLIRLTKEEDARSALTFSAISGAVFLAINLPFMAWDFQAWLFGLLRPVIESQNFLGVGLSRLAEYGILMIPRSAFGLFQLAFLAAAAVLYWLHYRSFRSALWIVPGIVGWLSYRSLFHYWAFLAFPLLLELVVRPAPIVRQPVVSASVESPRYQRLLTGAVVAACVLLLGGTLTWSSTLQNALSIAVERPVQTTDNFIDTLRLTVTNNSHQVLTPRFLIDGSFTHQSVFWQIQSGPQQVEPGETGDFVITGKAPIFSIPYWVGAEVIVTDAENYDLRATAFLDTDYAALYPDAVPNGNFAYWRADQNAPTNWSLMNNPAQPSPVTWSSEPAAPSPILHFQVTETNPAGWSSVKLDTQSIFPEVPIQVWVKPPSGANLAPAFSAVYGLELSVNDKLVWVLFGDQAQSGQIQPGILYWLIPAPRDTWSLQTIIPREIFGKLGLYIYPSARQPVYRAADIDYPSAAFHLRLLLATRGQPLAADFGPVNAAQLLPDRDTLVAQAISHPEFLLIWRGDTSRQTRNYDIALDNYRRALAQNPDAARAYIGTGWTYFDLQQYDQARLQFERAIEMMTAHLDDYGLSDLGEAQAGIGWIELRQGQCADALIRLDQAQRSGAAVDFSAMNAEARLCTATPTPEITESGSLTD